MIVQETILDGRVNLYQRGKSGIWQCASYLDGKNHRTSTGETNIVAAREFAEHWFMKFKLRQSQGEKLSDKSFAQAAERFMKEYEVMTGGTRNKDHIRGQYARITNHLLPYLRVSDLLCMSNMAHASLTKEHDNDDDIQRSIRPAAERR